MWFSQRREIQNSFQEVTQVYYETLTKKLYELAPDAKLPDQIGQIYTRNEVDNAFELLLKYVKKGFWVIFAIAALLAMLKFVFH